MRTLLAMRLSLLIAVTCGLATVPHAGFAQTSNSLALPPNLVRRFGLEHMWTTQVQVDRGRGRVLSITPYVSSLNSHTLFEVTHEFGKTSISERQLDQFGRPLGMDAAKAKAEHLVEELKKLYPDSKTVPVITPRVIPEMTLYATTELGTIHAIDAETGRTKWATTVGKVGYPTTQAAANDRFVSLINGSSIYVLRATDGTLHWQRRMAGIPMAGPALSEKYVFAPTSRGLIESYTLEDEGEPAWTFKGAGRALIQPVTSNNTMAWPSDEGHIYVTSTNPRAMRYRMESHHTISSSPAILGTRLFATSVDGYLYCLNLLGEQVDARRVLWKFALGESSSRAPAPIDDSCYVLTDQDQMFSVGVTNGAEQWRTTGIRRFVAASKTRIYVSGSAGRLIVLDKKSGAHLAEIPTEEFDLPIANLATDRLFLATSTGVLQCVREVGNIWPVIHGEATEVIKPRRKIIQKGLDDEGALEEKEKPKAADPFGNNDDPFGGGEAKPKPMKAVEDDPFGAPSPAPAPATKPDAKDDPFG